nr:MAG TPA: hypothetical protein [Caudoviricetes sp.]
MQAIVPITGRGRDRTYNTRKGKSGRGFFDAESAPDHPHTGGLSQNIKGGHHDRTYYWLVQNPSDRRLLLSQ